MNAGQAQLTCPSTMHPDHGAEAKVVALKAQLVPSGTLWLGGGLEGRGGGHAGGQLDLYPAGMAGYTSIHKQLTSASSVSFCSMH
jgi:hypothetical protein